jgi:osmotically-inducible protein OsmY
VVELHGTVPELSRRQKAVAVARATVGVNDVVDALSE